MKRLVLCLVAVAYATVMFGQSEALQSYSPYSIFGFGNLETLGTQNSDAMGGTGIANRDNNTINILNPAAVTARDSKTFMLDFGLMHQDIIYSANPATSTSATTSTLLKSARNLANIHHIVASFPIYKSSAFKVGLAPYSSTGYNFSEVETDDKLIVEAGDILYSKWGEGGVYQLFAGAGVTFFDRLSVGADFIYYIGTIDKYSNVQFRTNTYQREVTKGYEWLLRGFSGKFGLQYQQPLGKDYFLTLGATYKLSSNLGGEYEVFSIATKTSGTSDTLSYRNVDMKYRIPQEFGAGFVVGKTDKWKAAFDYTHQDWRNVDFTTTEGVNYATSVMQAFRAGFEIIPSKYSVRYYMHRVTYRCGAYYQNGYMTLNGSPVNTMGLTFGMSFPINNNKTSISFSLDFGQTGSLQNNLIRENYFKLKVGLNLYDIWFQKFLYN